MLDILPALPAEWPMGSISGIAARGQLTIGKLAWDIPNGTVDLQLVSGVEQTITLRLPPHLKLESTTVLAGDARSRHR